MHSFADFEMAGQVTAQISARTHRDHLDNFDGPADALFLFKATCCRHFYTPRGLFSSAYSCNPIMDGGNYGVLAKSASAKILRDEFKSLLNEWIFRGLC
jgi:hypothetical protein